MEQGTTHAYRTTPSVHYAHVVCAWKHYIKFEKATD